MRSNYIFTSESVSEGHPDKVADQISDAIVDLFLGQGPGGARRLRDDDDDPAGSSLAGEIRCRGIMDEDGNWAPGVRDEIEAAVRDDGEADRLRAVRLPLGHADFENHLHGQSAHIAQGVDASGNKDEGAGDQGIMFGFACDETPDLMPATLYYSPQDPRADGRRPPLAAPRRSWSPTPRARSRCAYENGKPVAATTIVVSTQHAPGYSTRATKADRPSTQLRDYVKGVFADVLPGRLLSDETSDLRQPDRQLRDRRAGRRRRPHRPQDHRRHLWRRGPAWRRRVQRQGPDQGRSLGRLCHPLSRQEHRRRRPRQALHDPALLRDRRRRAAVALCRSARHRAERRDRGAARGGAADAGAADAQGHPHPSRPQQADLREDRRLRPFRPQGRGRSLHLGEDGPGRPAEGGALAAPATPL